MTGPGHNTEASAAGPSGWADTWALAGNYPGQTGHVGRAVGGGTLRYTFAGLPKSAEVYLAVAPAIISAASGLPVLAGGNASFVSAAYFTLIGRICHFHQKQV